MTTVSPDSRAGAIRGSAGSWIPLRRDWGVLTVYQRFEACVALILTLVIGAVIIIALVRLSAEVLDTLLLRALNPLDHSVFQRVFGEIMTLLIALEFNHTLQYVVAHKGGIIQTRVVILIALLALARKVIVVDLYEAAPASVAALGGLALALGATYWLIDDRSGRRRALRSAEGDADAARNRG
jgi:uncharacterized membrane protein (DUF373 family)